jgi:hypothetical protein
VNLRDHDIGDLKHGHGKTSVNDRNKRAIVNRRKDVEL